MEPTGRPKFEQTGRRVFDHDVPPWIDPDASDYFITICCKQRGENQLCVPGIGKALLESACFYYTRQKWFLWVFVLMPDHVHMIAAFNRQYRIEAVIENWKRYAATKHQIVWQRGFFEHRLRGNESLEEKAEYIRQNPVRTGLVEEAKGWPYILDLRD